MKDCDPQDMKNTQGKPFLSQFAALKEFPAHTKEKKPGRLPESECSGRPR